jgi:hypothetical protein
MRDAFAEEIIRAVREQYSTPRKATAHERVSSYPPVKQLRGTPIVSPGVGSTSPGTDPATDADLSPVTQHERLEAALNRLRRERGEGAVHVLTKYEVAAIARGIERNLDDALTGKDREGYDNLIRTYMFKGHPDLPPDWNQALTDVMRSDELDRLGRAMKPKERRTYRDAAVEDAIQLHPEKSSYTLSTWWFDGEKGFSHDTINRVKKRLERRQMDTAVTEIREHVDQRFDRLEARESDRDRLESMRAETLDSLYETMIDIRETVEILSLRFPDDPLVRDAVERFED